MMPIEGAPPIDNSIDGVHALVAVVLFVTAWATGSVVALALAVLATLLLVAARSDYKRYAVYDVGRYDRIQVRGTRGVTAECAECESPADGGTVARTFTEVVLAGIVLARIDESRRHYCDDHGHVAAANDLTELQAQDVLNPVAADED